MVKSEKEIVWLLKLLANFGRGFFKKGKLGCIRDFEITADAPFNNKDFRSWIKPLIIFEDEEKRGIGNHIKLYRLDEESCYKKLRKNKHYKDIHAFFDSRSTAGVSF